MQIEIVDCGRQGGEKDDPEKEGEGREEGRKGKEI
jgi:hypothetical protein